MHKRNLTLMNVTTPNTLSALRVMTPLLVLSCLCLSPAHAATTYSYSTYTTWDAMNAATTTKYQPYTRISENDGRFTGFWFFGAQQFDKTGRYALAMKVNFERREVTRYDVAEIGYYDLQNANKWTKIGTSTAWNWQQGNRLQWRPNSDEILWNDRADDNSHYITRVYNFATGARRILPRPIFSVSHDGKQATSLDFQRVTWNGCDYVGIPDAFASQRTPTGTGLWMMDLTTGSTQLLQSLKSLVDQTTGYDPNTMGNLYLFQTNWSKTDQRVGVHLKSVSGYSRSATVSRTGTNLRWLYVNLGHQDWIDDTTLVGGGTWCTTKDDNTQRIYPLPGAAKLHPDIDCFGGALKDWVLCDNYPWPSSAANGGGVQYVYLFHLPTGLYIPIAKQKNTAPISEFRTDQHVRSSRDHRLISWDNSESGGRQLYVANIGHILDNPPGNTAPTVSLSTGGTSFTAPATITLTATASDSNGTVSKVDFYQGTTLLGTDTTSPYTFTKSSVAAGTYGFSAKATDNGGAVGSSTTVSVTVTSSGPTAPAITTQPPSTSVSAGQTATFSVVAAGTAPLAFQWQKNGVNISGATSASYTTPATATADNGATFRVIVKNSISSVTSASATLTVTSSSGLVALWKLDETLSATIAADSSGNAFKGTLGNYSASGWTTGKIGGALNFNGVANVVSVGSPAALTNLARYTIAAWIKPRTLGEGLLGRVLNKRNSGVTAGWSLFLGAGTVTFRQTFSTTEGAWSMPANAVALGAWQHVALTYDTGSAANRPIFYRNGVVVTTTVQTAPSGSRSSDAASTLSIGNTSTLDRTFDGGIDDVRIYNRIMSASEISGLATVMPTGSG
jgi:hypothetical protein